jgi:hypothetical protein
MFTSKSDPVVTQMNESKFDTISIAKIGLTFSGSCSLLSSSNLITDCKNVNALKGDERSG